MTFGAPVPALRLETPGRWSAGSARSLIPLASGEFRQRRRQRVHRVLGELRIGDMPLHAVHGESAAQGASTSHLDVSRSRPPLEALPPRTSRGALPARAAVAPRAACHRPTALLVTRDQKGDRPPYADAPRRLLAGGEHRRKSALHVGRSAPVQHAVTDLRRDGSLCHSRAARWAPRRCVRRKQNSGPAPPRRAQKFSTLQSSGARCGSPPRSGARHDLLAAFIRRGDRATCDESLSQFNSLRHYLRGFGESTALVAAGEAVRVYTTSNRRGASGTSCHAPATPAATLASRHTDVAVTSPGGLTALLRRCHQSVTSLSSNAPMA